MSPEEMDPLDTVHTPTAPLPVLFRDLRLGVIEFRWPLMLTDRRKKYQFKTVAGCVMNAGWFTARFIFRI
jgi:hypothetical protein